MKVENVTDTTTIAMNMMLTQCASSRLRRVLLLSEGTTFAMHEWITFPARPAQGRKIFADVTTDREPVSEIVRIVLGFILLVDCWFFIIFSHHHLNEV